MDLIQINNSIEALKQLRLSVSNVFEVSKMEEAPEIAKETQKSVYFF